MVVWLRLGKVVMCSIDCGVDGVDGDGVVLVGVVCVGLVVVLFVVIMVSRVWIVLC